MKFYLYWILLNINEQNFIYTGFYLLYKNKILFVLDFSNYIQTKFCLYLILFTINEWNLVCTGFYLLYMNKIMFVLDFDNSKRTIFVSTGNC